VDDDDDDAVEAAGSRNQFVLASRTSKFHTSGAHVSTALLQQVVAELAKSGLLLKPHSEGTRWLDQLGIAFGAMANYPTFDVAPPQLIALGDHAMTNLRLSLAHSNNIADAGAARRKMEGECGDAVQAAILASPPAARGGGKARGGGRGGGRGGRGGRGRGSCFNCGQYGHYATACPSNAAAPGGYPAIMPPPAARGGGYPNASGGRGMIRL
jgi:hypothetical protein